MTALRAHWEPIHRAISGLRDGSAAEPGSSGVAMRRPAAIRDRVAAQMVANGQIARPAGLRASPVATAPASGPTPPNPPADRPLHPEQAGFSIIELIVVSTIVAILAAAAIPAYQEYSVRAKVVEGLGWIAKVRQEIALVIDVTGSPPPNNAAAGLDPVATNNNSSYVASVSINDGSITVAFQNTGNTAVDAGSLVFSPDTSQGNVRWTCRPNDMALAAYMPSTCRSGS